MNVKTPPAVLKPTLFRNYIDQFNLHDNELYTGAFKNADAFDFLSANIPLFDCPDNNLMEIYYFRWWSYRKHIRQIPDGFIITEFLPDVPWAGKHNSINCAAGHHFYEGRWLHNGKYLDDYATFWLRKGGAVRSYSFWIADALWNRYLVTGDAREIKELFPDLIANYDEWEKTNLDESGLFWQIDDRDGMEFAIGDNAYKPGCRPTINSYMYGDARAIGNIAELKGDDSRAAKFRNKASKIKQLVQKSLWDEEAEFFKVLPVRADAKLSTGRELFGYTPWYFNLPDKRFASAWKQLMDPAGFHAPFGPTTAERRDPQFQSTYTGHECQWNGPSWPYATSVTLTALANLLNSDPQSIVSKDDYFNLLSIYASSQHLQLDDGTIVPWIDENLNPFTGEWIARSILKSKPNTLRERGKDYNHSTFCDLIITGLIGLRPRADNAIEVHPLLPDTWDYFCLDNIRYHDKTVTILYDRSGDRYKRGKGLIILADGEQIGESPSLAKLTAPLSKN